MMKKHWPLLFTILVVIISIILGVTASNSTDTGVAIVFGVITFMFLFPLAGAVLGGWYGWKMKSPWKWLLAPAVYLGVILYLIIMDLVNGAGMTTIGSNFTISAFAGITCLVVEAIVSFVAWLVRRNRASNQSEQE